MSRIYTCFPGGKFKAVTLSYDDGKIMDRRLIEILNQNGLRATFHLNSELLGKIENHKFPYVSGSEIKELYKGHEIACHTCTHPTLTRIPTVCAVNEVIQDRKNLENYVGYPVIGMSYPNGCFDENIKSILENCGIRYCRTTKNTERFDLPRDYLEWNPTCRHTENLLELTEKFIKTEFDQKLMLFYIWGHSYEFEIDQNWELIETFADRIGGRDDIWYATNIEIYNYMKATSQLYFLANQTGVYNPTGQDIWLKVDDVTYEIPARQQIRFGVENRPSYYLTPNHQILYRPCTSGEGKLDKDLVAYRMKRPAKITGNPYTFLGEAIGDMRDNMYPQAERIATQVTTIDKVYDNIHVRIYEPQKREKKSACLIFIHGGSFIGGSLEIVEESCRLLGEKANVLVINVGYRLAPEHPFPEGILDCKKAIEYVYNDSKIKFDRKKIYLGGDSAGGNLVLASIQSKKIRKKIAGLILLYPVTDMTNNSKYWKWNEEMYLGGKDGMEKHCASSLKGCETIFQKLYVQNADINNPLISPINMEINTNFPRTLLLTAEYDYLRKQSEAFGRKLYESGVDIRMIRYGGMCHAFFDLLGKTSQTERCIEDIAEFITHGSN